VKKAAKATKTAAAAPKACTYKRRFVVSLDLAYSGWHKGLPDKHYAGRIWFRTDNGTCTLYPVSYLGNMMYISFYIIGTTYRVFEHKDLANVYIFGPNPRWARCEPPEEPRNN
jgi:hypothetical protein